MKRKYKKMFEKALFAWLIGSAFMMLALLVIGFLLLIWKLIKHLVL